MLNEYDINETRLISKNKNINNFNFYFHRYWKNNITLKTIVN